MAKIKKRKLRWKASESQQVVGYRLYWAEGEDVGYSSPSVALGNVTEVVLPDEVDGFAPKGGPVSFGVAAIDELGNESDMATFAAPYQFNVPLAPEELWIESLDEFHAQDKGDDAPDASESSEPIALFVKGTQHSEPDEEQAQSADPEDGKETYESVQHYGYPEE